MKRGAWCAAVVLVALTGCRKQEAPPAVVVTAPPPPSAPPAPELLSAEALEKQPVFTSLEAALREPEKVYRLDLGARPDAPRLQALPAEVGRLVKLQELKLQGQGLTELPKELGRLRALQRLEVSDNALAALPGELGQLAALTELRLAGNRLQELPEELGHLRRLETLELARNELQHFPGFVVALPALQTLTLHSNPFQVSLALGQVKTLRRVEVGEAQADLDALRESLPKVSWAVHAEGESAEPAPAGAHEELEVAQPEPQEEAAVAPKPGSSGR
jgi:Leucine rich repeat